MKIIEKNLFTLCMPFSSSFIIKHKVHTLRCFVFNFFNCSGKGASFHWLNTTSNHCIYSKKHRPRFKTNNRLQGWYYVKDISSHQNDKNRWSRTVRQCKKVSPLACHARRFTYFAFLPMHFQGKESLLVAYQSVSQHHHCFQEPCQEHCHKAGSSLFQAFSWSLVRKTAPERFKKSLPLAALFFYFFVRYFPLCTLTNWTPGRGQAGRTNLVEARGGGGNGLYPKSLSRFSFKTKTELHRSINRAEIIK